MRRRRKTKITAMHWVTLAVMILAVILIIICAVYLCSDDNSAQDPVYLPDGDVVFVPNDD